MFPTLIFAEGGWCEALKTSYAPGAYAPKSREEYEALAHFAVDAPALEQAAPEPVKRGPGRPKGKE